MIDINFNALPILIFAHKFTTDDFRTHFKQTNKQIEITAITEGKITIICNGKEETAQKGDILCRFNRASDVDCNALHTHHTTCFAVDIKEGDTALSMPSIIRSPENFSSCLHIIDKIIQESLKSPQNHLKLSGLFIQLIGEVDIACNPSQTQNSPGEQRYVDRAKKYIYEHITEPIAQNDIANHLGITPEYLCFIFKRCENRSVIRFINEIKLTHVKSLMENNNLSLKQASMQYGFSDPNYVSKLYKKYYNETLSQALKIL